MTIDGIDPGNVGIKLDIDHNIAVRTGLHCAPLVHEQLGTLATAGGVRFSLGAFTTDDDVEAALTGIAEIAHAAGNGL